VGSQLVAVTIGDEPLDKAKEYNVVTIDFLTGGGDNFLEEVDAPILDLMADVLTSYIEAQSPIPADYSVADRVVVTDGQAGSGSSGNATATTSGTAATSTPTGANDATRAGAVGVLASIVAFVAAAMLA